MPCSHSIDIYGVLGINTHKQIQLLDSEKKKWTVSICSSLADFKLPATPRNHFINLMICFIIVHGVAQFFPVIFC